VHVVAAFLKSMGIMLSVVLTVGDSLLSTFGDISEEWLGQQKKTEMKADTIVSGPFGLEVTASSTAQVTLSNDGEEPLAMFEDWDLIFEIQESPGIDVLYLTYSSTTPPATSTWAIEGLYLDAASSTAEIIEPGVFNPGEEMVIIAKPSQAIVANTYDRITFVTDNGTVTKVTFKVNP